MGILKPSNITGLPKQLGVFTVGSPPGTGLPSATRFTGGMIFISDALTGGSPGGPGAGSPLIGIGGTLAVSNGSDWVDAITGNIIVGSDV